jgi:cytidyltransferase-like protein
MKIALVTGGFDPLHSGHIEYFKAARELGDILIVGLNSDEWLQRKKGQSFMHISERIKIVSSLKVVDRVVCYPDADGSSKNTIIGVRAMYPDATIVFANGGDRTVNNIPEMDVNDDNLIFKFGVGGTNKSNSSSWILKEWKAPKTARPWGYYRILHEVDGTKVKELTVDPGQKLSMQRHKHRSEFWFVTEGTATVKWDEFGHTKIVKHNSDFISNEEWHQLINDTDQPLKIIEIQYGTQCSEDDIERL